MTRRAFLSTTAASTAAAANTRDFDITDHGARDDGRYCTAAIAKAIAACSAPGGGRVVVPQGSFFTGPVHLRSATLKFSTDPGRYLPVVFTLRGDRVDELFPAHLRLRPIADRDHRRRHARRPGNATNWWPWKGSTAFGWRKGDPDYKPARDRLINMASRNVPVSERVFGGGSYLRPNLIQPTVAPMS